MIRVYHLEITYRALRELFSPSALEEVIEANLKQDNFFPGQIGHAQFHFDSNSFAKSKAYMEEQRAMILPALKDGDGRSARQAFGRLTHAAQDLYAHSNYVSLWLEKHPEGGKPAPEQVDPLDGSILESPLLRSGKVYYPFEILAYLPLIKRAAIPLLPRDSHTWMNLDTPDRGPGFFYAIEAAVKRTRYEYELSIQELDPGLLALFL